jgi:hypothetical protein
MWTVLKLSPRAIAAIAGWKPGTITGMLETYGHADVGAFEEVDAAFAGIEGVEHGLSRGEGSY